MGFPANAATISFKLNFDSNGAAMEFVMASRKVDLITQGQFDAVQDLYAAQSRHMLQTNGDVSVEITLR